MAQGVQDLLQGCLAILYQACFESLTLPQGGLQRQRSYMDLICTHIRRSAFERVDETQHGSGIELSPLKLETCLPRVKVTQELSQDCQQDFVVPPRRKRICSKSSPSIISGKASGMAGSLWFSGRTCQSIEFMASLSIK